MANQSSFGYINPQYIAQPVQQNSGYNNSSQDVQSIVQTVNQTMQTLNNMMFSISSSLDQKLTQNPYEPPVTPQYIQNMWQSRPSNFYSTGMPTVQPTASPWVSFSSALPTTPMDVNGQSYVNSLFALNRVGRAGANLLGYTLAYRGGEMLGAGLGGTVGAIFGGGVGATAGAAIGKFLGGMIMSFGFGDKISNGLEALYNHYVPTDKAYQMALIENITDPRKRISESPLDSYLLANTHVDLLSGWKEYLKVQDVTKHNAFYNKYDTKLLYTKLLSGGLMSTSSGTDYEIQEYQNKFKDLLKTTRTIQDALQLNIKDALDLMKQFRQSGFSTSYMRQIAAYSRAVGNYSGLSPAFVSSEIATWGQTGQRTIFGNRWYSEMGAFNLAAAGSGYNMLSNRQIGLVNSYGGKQQVIQNVTNALMQASTSPEVLSYLAGLPSVGSSNYMMASLTGTTNMALGGYTDSLSLQEKLQSYYASGKLTNVSALIGIRQKIIEDVRMYEAMGLPKDIAVNRALEALGIKNPAEKAMILKELSKTNLETQTLAYTYSTNPDNIMLSGRHKMDYWNFYSPDNWQAKLVNLTLGGDLWSGIAQTFGGAWNFITSPLRAGTEHIQESTLQLSQWFGDVKKWAYQKAYGLPNSTTESGKSYYQGVYTTTINSGAAKSLSKFDRHTLDKNITHSVSVMLNAFMSALGATRSSTVVLSTDAAKKLWKQFITLQAFTPDGKINPDVGTAHWIAAVGQDSGKKAALVDIIKTYGMNYNIPYEVDNHGKIVERGNMYSKWDPRHLFIDVWANNMTESMYRKMPTYTDKQLKMAISTGLNDFTAENQQAVNKTIAERDKIIDYIKHYHGNNVFVRSYLLDTVLPKLKNLTITDFNSQNMYMSLHRFMTELKNPNITLDELGSTINTLTQVSRAGTAAEQVHNLKSSDIFSPKPADKEQQIQGKNPDITQILKDCVDSSSLPEKSLRVTIVADHTRKM